MAEGFEEYADGCLLSDVTKENSKRFFLQGLQFFENDRVFLMFGSANRDEDIFEKPNEFRLDRDVTQSISFGAGLISALEHGSRKHSLPKLLYRCFLKNFQKSNYNQKWNIRVGHLEVRNHSL